MMRNQRGFTFIELLTVILILGILASFAVGRYLDLKHRALSASAASDMESVRFAAYSAMHGNNGEWPPEQGAGVVPPEMVSYLGPSFVFSHPDYTLDWENLGAGGGMQVGVTVSSTNPRLMHALIQSLGSKGPFLAIGNQLTLVIVGPDGQS